MLPPAGRCRTTCDLVLAHCHEDLTWLVEASRIYRAIYVYTKCSAAIPPESIAPRNIFVETMANVGSNDAANLRHITKHYDQLAPLTVFCEAAAAHGGALEGQTCCPDTVVRPEPERAEYSYLGQFATHEHSARYTRRSSRLASLRAFRKKGGYTFMSNTQMQNSTAAKWLSSTDANLGAWAERTLGKELAGWTLGQAQWLVLGGYFAAERDNLRRYPRATYAAMAAEQTAANEEVDHFIERAWGLLLTTSRLPPED